MPLSVLTNCETFTHSTLNQVLMGRASEPGAGFMADVYSFGVVVWEIFTGKLPWEGMTPFQMMDTVATQKKRLYFLPTFPACITALLAACWAHEPT